MHDQASAVPAAHPSPGPQEDEAPVPGPQTPIDPPEPKHGVARAANWHTVRGSQPVARDLQTAVEEQRLLFATTQRAADDLTRSLATAVRLQSQATEHLERVSVVTTHQSSTDVVSGTQRTEPA
ncbi:hypothetical protein [Streptomyces sp. B6B3]|uniref:hypothetical protein n=1 Tax=Streptomyces sp. B6B3 TaxID=3153570 RepID=UPI00325D7509